jgi:hypothetical protein
LFGSHSVFERGYRLEEPLEFGGKIHITLKGARKDLGQKPAHSSSWPRLLKKKKWSRTLSISQHPFK